MTKPEWANLIIGDKVKREWPEIDRSQEPPKMVMKTQHGVVKRISHGGY